MSRYIDADALIEFIDLGHYRNPLELCYSEQYVVDMIESRPTADVVERKYGEWIIREPIHMHSICSCCGYYNAINPYYVYCPNCGATMSYERRLNNGDQIYNNASGSGR